MKYQKIKVEFMVGERELEALEELKVQWQQYKGEDGSFPFKDYTVENMFQTIMEIGSKYTISEKIKQEQWRQHLISDEEFFNKEEFRTKSEREAGTSQKA
ncbi:hypothetical protein HGO97_007520 [Faecalicatena sp. AGMB00832]|uniref:Uncharacterized protein n=1 Tax=Faecalicatena faecalis TaxID=2726362 RepID=A0ABS6D241_9FIRM|nr:hypothetical protein [Faecalicatena faecalis]MBU3875659.1 hypothetical protein [Faecalicatena faecalis]